MTVVAVRKIPSALPEAGAPRVVISTGGRRSGSAWERSGEIPTRCPSLAVTRRSPNASPDRRGSRRRIGLKRTEPGENFLDRHGSDGMLAISPLLLSRTAPSFPVEMTRSCVRDTCWVR
jgi:hypothetical protein